MRQATSFSRGMLSAVAAILLFSAIIVGCKKSTTSSIFNDSPPIKLTANTFDFIGEEHNNGLDYVYSNTFSTNRHSKPDDVLGAVDRFVFEVSPITKASKDNRKNLFSVEKKQLLLAAIKSRSIIIDRATLQKKLTSNQFAMVEKLNEAFNLPTHVQRLQKINSLTNEALNTLGENEIVYILCSFSLAKHSLEYWNSQRGKQWMEGLSEFFSQNETQQIKSDGYNDVISIKVDKIDWRNVAVADVGAFLAGFPAGVKVGALVGGVTAGIASAGITSGLGAVLGGVVGGTATGIATAIGASSLVLAAEIAVDWFW